MRKAQDVKQTPGKGVASGEGMSSGDSPQGHSSEISQLAQYYQLTAANEQQAAGKNKLEA